MNKSHNIKSWQATSTVGRGKSITLQNSLGVSQWSDSLTSLHLGDSLHYYECWQRPNVIISDGAYGVLGFEGDTSDHLELPKWYEAHIEAWSKFAMSSTTLWFWNSEIGWAAVHPVLEKHGWRYVNANIWNKGKGHIAGNVHTNIIRRFPVVTEMCVQYIFEPKINGLSLKKWLLQEWKRTGLPLRRANEACGVADAAVRKYFDQGHLWYFPPPEKFSMLVEYANTHGNQTGKPYFSINGKDPLTGAEWLKMRSKFYCPHGVTNVWDRDALRGAERVKTPSGKAVHLNQKPLDLMKRIIEVSSDEGDVIWEPFGGLFSASLAARQVRRRSFAAETDNTYFYYGLKRFTEEVHQHPLL